MNNELTEKVELAYMSGIPTPIQFTEALHRLTNYFKGRGLTHEQIDKAFQYCLFTHDTK